MMTVQDVGPALVAGERWFRVSRGGFFLLVRTTDETEAKRIFAAALLREKKLESGARIF